MEVQWFWLVVVVQAGGTGLLGLVLGGISMRHDTRISNLEWLQTVPLDERIEARQRQRAHEEAKALHRAYGLGGNAPVQTQRPVATMLRRYMPPADPWQRNGRHE